MVKQFLDSWGYLYRKRFNYFKRADERLKYRRLTYPIGRAVKTFPIALTFGSLLLNPPA